LPLASGQKISSGQVKKYSGQGQVGLLFTAGQKHARVGLGQGTSLLISKSLFPSHFSKIKLKS